MIRFFRITNSKGAYIELTNYGASLVSVVVPDKAGKPGNVILNYPRPEDYLSDTFYLGSTIGRVANRISAARFSLNGKKYLLEKNDGENTNHGGFSGFNKKLFDYAVKDNEITFSAESPDNEGGYPGAMSVSVTYSWNDCDELQITYRALSDQATPFNPTNHAYFNLSSDGDDILDHELKINANAYLESDNAFLPTGKIRPVADTAFDFRAFRKIKDMMPLKNEIIKGFNKYFICNKTINNALAEIAVLKAAKSGRELRVYSTMPGVMLYTGDYLSGHHKPFAGLCLEAQYYPDAVNHPHFVNCLLQPGVLKEDIIKFAFR